MVIAKGTQMRTTTVLYTCDRCGEKFPETKVGWYPSGWTRTTIFNIERNVETVKNKELCNKCSLELWIWILNTQTIEEPSEETKDAPVREDLS